MDFIKKRKECIQNFQENFKTEYCLENKEALPLQSIRENVLYGSRNGGCSSAG